MCVISTKFGGHPSQTFWRTNRPQPNNRGANPTRWSATSLGGRLGREWTQPFTGEPILRVVESRNKPRSPQKTSRVQCWSAVLVAQTPLSWKVAKGMLIHVPCVTFHMPWVTFDAQVVHGALHRGNTAPWVLPSTVFPEWVSGLRE
jgi:hypothetical protein